MSGIASEYFKKERMNGVVDEAGLTVVSWLLGIGDGYTRMHFPVFYFCVYSKFSIIKG